MAESLQLLSACARVGMPPAAYRRIAALDLDDYDETKFRVAGVCLERTRGFFMKAKAIVGAQAFAAFVGDFAEERVHASNCGAEYAGTAIRNPTGACIKRLIAKIERGELGVIARISSDVARPNDGRGVPPRDWDAENPRFDLFDDYRNAGRIAWHSRWLVHLSLPHRDPGTVNEWCRKRRNYELAIVPSTVCRALKIPSSGFPFGIFPRRLLIHMISEIKQSGSPDVFLGSSASDCLRRLGFSSSADNIQSLTKQCINLLTSQISYRKLGRGKKPGELELKYFATGFVAGLNLWWLVQPDGSDDLGHGCVRVSDQFFAEINESAFPVDIAAVKEIGHNTLALDIYLWATNRAFWLERNNRPFLHVPWGELAEQFASGFRRLRAFRAKFLSAVEQVKRVWPDNRLDLKETADGIIFRRSPLPIPARASRAPLELNPTQA